MPRTHYVYVSFRRETRQFYIGCRSGFSVGDDYFGFDDDTANPDRTEADRAVNTIAGLFNNGAA